MGYARKWEPPVLAIGGDLAVWKALCNDMCDGIETAGLVQTADINQLDIDAVSTIPNNGVMAGYRMYRFDDPLQSSYPIIIKIQFGVARYWQTSGSSSGSGRLWTTWQVGTATDGEGNFVGATSVEFNCPHSNVGGTASIGTVSNNPEFKGQSFICYNEDTGFLGFVYGAGAARPSPSSYAEMGLFTMFIQRSTTQLSGAPNGDGFMVYGPELLTFTSNWRTTVYSRSPSQYVSFTTGAVDPRYELNNRNDANTEHYIGTNTVAMPIFARSASALHHFPSLVFFNQYQVGEGVEFDCETIPGVTRNFVCLGNRTNMSVESLTGQWSSIGMLFE